jgi:Flp pilus assembly protein TadB
METMAFVILILGLVVANMWRRHLREAKQLKLRQIIHEERIKAMEHELPLPEINDSELLDSLSLSPSKEPQSESGLDTSITWVRLVTLGLGLVLLFGGIGGAIGLYWVADPEAHGVWPISLIPVFVAIGLLLFYLLSRRFAVASEEHGDDV